ncbi:hypothetical protein ACFX16_025632 [Malus domestica]
MSSVCAEQHKFHPSHQLLSSKKTLLRDTNIDIPPRKLLTRRSPQEFPSSDVYASADYGSPSFSSADEALLHKFLPYNTGSDDSDDDEVDPYSSDHFRMFEFKVRRCTRSRSHDWTDCPFAHPGEKARRRDPRRHHYSGTVCADYRRGSCSRGDSCEFAHGVFECWLHPARYRTEACKDGKNCKRKVCFFAHTPRQLRILPADQVLSPTASSKKLFHLNNHLSVGSPRSCSNNKQYCCLFCHPAAATSSPTSTLLAGMSHHLSPPVSPAGNCSSVSGFHSSPVMSRCGGLGLGGLDQVHASTGGLMTSKEVVAELMSSMEAMKFNEAAAAGAAASPKRWVDVSLDMNMNYASADDDLQPQQQFILSPSTPSPTRRPFGGGGRGINFFGGDENCSPTNGSLLGFDRDTNTHINKKEIVNGGGFASAGDSDPDLGWVNDLLM